MTLAKQGLPRRYVWSAGLTALALGLVSLPFALIVRDNHLGKFERHVAIFRFQDSEVAENHLPPLPRSELDTPTTFPRFKLVRYERPQR